MKKMIFLALTILLATQAAFSRSGYLGEDIVIAVPLPQISSAQKGDEWMAQFLQDSITTNFARFSKMTVIDRANENLVIAEYNLSESGFYDDERGVIELGKMTNAKFILAGKLQGVSGAYTANFRVNNIETNEIRSAFQGRYTLGQIESGKAANEISKEILLSLGIELDDKAIAALSQNGDSDIRAAKSLAKGTAAQKNGDEIEALYQFMLAGNSGKVGMEAAQNVQQILSGTISGANIKERAAQNVAMIEKWNGIFEKLGIWLEYNLPIFIYDFSEMEDEISSGGKYVTFSVKPGIKVVPNRQAVLFFKKICEQWENIRSDSVNKEWSGRVREWHTMPSYNDTFLRFCYSCHVGLFSEYGEMVKEKNVLLEICLRPRDTIMSKIIPSQQEYFNRAMWREVYSLSLEIQYMPDELSPGLYSIERYGHNISLMKNPPAMKDFQILSLEEYDAIYGGK